LRADPNDPMTFARRGILQVLLGRGEDAEADFEQFRNRYPEAGPYLERVIGCAEKMQQNPSPEAEAQLSQRN
jgi:hypothetical protein